MLAIASQSAASCTCAVRCFDMCILAVGTQLVHGRSAPPPQAWWPVVEELKTVTDKKTSPCFYRHKRRLSRCKRGRSVLSKRSCTLQRYQATSIQSQARNISQALYSYTDLIGKGFKLSAVTRAAASQHCAYACTEHAGLHARHAEQFLWQQLAYASLCSADLRDILRQ